jgi:hypothetical protein
MRSLLLLVLLPVLIAGPALGGMAAWLHAHGPHGLHLHLIAGEHEHADGGTIHDWHDSQHRDDDEGDRPEDGGPTPPGRPISLPEILAAPANGQARASAARLELTVLDPAPRWHLALSEIPHRPELCRSGWPPARTSRSGIAVLLLSSRAILI